MVVKVIYFLQVLRQSGKLKKVKLLEDDDYDGAEPRGTIELYGKWQLEPLQLPHAVNGIVPKVNSHDVPLRYIPHLHSALLK